MAGFFLVFLLLRWYRRFAGIRELLSLLQASANG
ncbi:hypothetical protein K788_00020790 [Paraburkholderia caribensis MBA4]|uniref:Uncharacterized protein n=1 Tax=Paraburkholderia caribensis MBA4 TaxID=1323664 RepID=A0A0P0R4V3_9BURK|nr:hypothetical protein K788_00020790 [Paraburkholderia caribensis MBA4]